MLMAVAVAVCFDYNLMIVEGGQGVRGGEGGSSGGGGGGGGDGCVDGESRLV